MVAMKSDIATVQISSHEFARDATSVANKNMPERYVAHDHPPIVDL